MNNKCFCGCLASLTLGIIGGIIIGITFFFLGATLSLPLILWTAFGLTLFSLAVLIFIASNNEYYKKTDRCICKFGNCILIGVIGSLIFELILAVATLGVIATAVLLGIGAIFFITAIISLLRLVFCLVNSNCMKLPCCRE